MLRNIQVTVDDEKPTEKVYDIALNIDISKLSAEGLKEYAMRDLTVKWVNANRKKGHQHMAGLGGIAVYVAPEPGTRTQADPFTTLQSRDLTEAEVKRLEAIIEAKRKVIVRKANA